MLKNPNKTYSKIEQTRQENKDYANRLWNSFSINPINPPITIIPLFSMARRQSIIAIVKRKNFHGYDNAGDKEPIYPIYNLSIYLDMCLNILPRN